MPRRRAGGAPRALEGAGSCSACGAPWTEETALSRPEKKALQPRGLRGRRRLGGEALHREGGPGVPTQRRSTRRLRGNPPDGGRTGNPGEHWGCALGAKSHGLEEATPPRPKKRGPAPTGLPPGAQLNCRW
ncbi:hypothetical protein NDU88_003364 [Pleurodeles waltl]|uniref:Uncharacterized protein n=1 Tax=Pleurodeles waltl TaxID=8319 RepID=A0AAV7Q979_PLEWA|nr:hypothetical protein NDU88_003364 [Pleurodeles waltl]